MSNTTTTPNSVIQLLSGYNAKYSMTKCLDTQTTIDGNHISCNLHNVGFSSYVDPATVNALASIGLLKLVENDLSALAVETRLKAIVAGKFAARRAGETKEVAPTLPEAIEQLPLSEIEDVVGDSLTTVKLSVKDLARFGLLDSLNAKTRSILQTSIDERLANAERVKVLFELFRISHATILADTGTSLQFTCQVPVTLWNSVFTKIKSSADRGWSVEVGSVGLDEEMTGMKFTLVLDKTMNDAVV